MRRLATRVRSGLYPIISLLEHPEEPEKPDQPRYPEQRSPFTCHEGDLIRQLAVKLYGKQSEDRS
jgi:hypothetical protein